MASARGLTTGVVTNAYWATAAEDAAEWLRPLAGRIRSLTVSSDAFHGSDAGSDALAAAAETAAAELGISCGVISIAGPDEAARPFVNPLGWRAECARFAPPVSRLRI